MIPLIETEDDRGVRVQAGEDVFLSYYNKACSVESQ